MTKLILPDIAPTNPTKIILAKNISIGAIGKQNGWTGGKSGILYEIPKEVYDVLMARDPYFFNDTKKADSFFYKYAKSHGWYVGPDRERVDRNGRVKFK